MRITRNRLVVALLVVGTVARVGLAWVALHGVYDPYAGLQGDMGKYLALGISLSRGEGFSLHYQPVLSTVLHGGAAATALPIPTASRSPGYPLFLAMLFATTGIHLRLVVIVQALLSALTALLVYLIAEELDARPVWALAFAVLYYPFAFEAAYVLTECLLTFLTAATLWLVVRPRRGVLAGVVAGLTILVKSVTFPFFVLAPLIDRRRVWLFWLGLVLVLLPWGVRNYFHTGVPYVTPSYGGYQLIQLHNAANREFPLFEPPGDLKEDYPGFQTIVEGARRRAASVTDPIAQEYLSDRELSKEVARFISADPRQFLRAVWRSLQNTWRLDYPSANWIRWLSNLGLYVGLFPFVLWGSIRAVRTGPTGARLLVCFLLYFVCAHAVVASEIRYRTAAMPAYFVLAAFGLPRRRLLSAPTVSVQRS